MSKQLGSSEGEPRRFSTHSQRVYVCVCVRHSVEGELCFRRYTQAVMWYSVSSDDTQTVREEKERLAPLYIRQVRCENHVETMRSKRVRMR